MQRQLSCLACNHPPCRGYSVLLLQDKAAAFPRMGSTCFQGSSPDTAERQSKIWLSYCVIASSTLLPSQSSTLGVTQLQGSSHPSDTKYRHIPSTLTASPGGNRLTPMPHGSATPNFESLVYKHFFYSCFRLLLKTHHADLNRFRTLQAWESSWDTLGCSQPEGANR